jgi:hypothetical protein
MGAPPPALASARKKEWAPRVASQQRAGRLERGDYWKDNGTRSLPGGGSSHSRASHCRW